MSFILGCDASSTKLAYCLLYHHDSVTDAVVGDTSLGSPFTTHHPLNAYHAISGFLVQALREFDGKLSSDDRRSFVEAPIGHRNVQVAIKQAMVNGAVQTSLAEWEFTPILVAPSSWKKGVGLSGSAGKPAVADWLDSSYPKLSALCAYDQDRIDACTIAVYGSVVVDRARDALATEGSLHRPDGLVLQSARMLARL